MSHKTFIVFDPETHAILGTITTPDHTREHTVGGDNKINILSVKFEDNIRYDPEENKIYSI